MNNRFTSAQFSTELFSMANNKDFSDKCVFVPHTKKQTLDAGADTLTITLEVGEKFKSTHADEDGTVDDDREGIAYINGLKLGVDATGAQKSAPDAGEFIYAWAAGSDTAGATLTFTINEADKALIGANEVKVFYETVEEQRRVSIDNTTSAVGELVAKYPK